MKGKVSKGHICSNSSCCRSYSEPRIIIDVKSNRTMNVCPYCFTKLTIGYTVECSHYFGYLSEKESRGEIPEECLTCIDTLFCMLSKIQKSDRSNKEIAKWYKS